MRRLWIVVAGVVALAVTVALAVVGVAPDGGHTWIESIQSAVREAVTGGPNPTGGHTWIE